MKILAVDATGLSRDALHVHVGLFLFIGVHLVSRLPLRHPLPWIAVLLVTLGGEWYDLTYENWPDRAMQLRESIHDVFNTMLEPTIIVILAHLTPGLFAAGANRISPESGSGTKAADDRCESDASD